MSLILRQAASPEILNYVWKKSHSDKAVWQAGLPRWEMEPDIVYHILKISRELESGAYRPDPVRFFYVNKGDGKQRLISSYTLRDKIAQRAVLSVLEPIGEQFFHPDSFGFRPKRSTEMCVDRVCQYMLSGFVWAVDADIQDCFENIPYDLLFRVLESFLRDEEVIRLIRRWLMAGNPLPDISPEYGRGLPQGAVISPFLCNVYLSWWDFEMTARSLPFVRYGDDIMVMAKTREAAESAYLHTAEILHRMGLELHPEKTRVTHCGSHVQFLGKTLPDLFN